MCACCMNSSIAKSHTVVSGESASDPFASTSVPVEVSQRMRFLLQRLSMVEAALLNLAELCSLHPLPEKELDTGVH